MFTGLVEAIGTVKTAAPKEGGMSLSVRIPFKPLMGESIAVNGICLTVSGLFKEGFYCDLSPETLGRTTMSRLKPGANVHVERALPAEGRFGGHLVTGHIDGTGRIAGRKEYKDTVVMDIEIPGGLSRYLVEKGSIAVDGVSLTINSVRSSVFSATLIPFTLKMTLLGKLGPGDEVNLEVDMISKLVVQTVSRILGKDETTGEEGGDGITQELLEKSGFIK